MNNYGIANVAVGYGKTFVGNCDKNADAIIETVKNMAVEQPEVIVLPELAITGYTCGDLFNQTQLLKSAERAAAKVALETRYVNAIIFFGCPVKIENSLYNCAIVVNNGNIIGIVPKQHLPNYKEFYEERWFKAADGSEPKTISFGDRKHVPFGTNLIFQNSDKPDFKVAAEICEDIWMPVPPSCFQSVHGGAVVLVNLSASNETVGKSEYRKALVENQSGRCIAVYAYASCGPTESTTDVVFGGDCLIAENGSVLNRTDIFKDEDWVISAVDIEKLLNERRRTTSFAKNTYGLDLNWRYIEFSSSTKLVAPYVARTPFVPTNPATLEQRCNEIFNIQVAGLAKRMSQLGPNANFTIGVSGGLDSTLALLVAVKACEKLKWNPSVIKGITMPGFGTSGKTRSNALKLMDLLKISTDTIDICTISHQMFKDINHEPFGLINPNCTLDDFKVHLAESVPAGSKDLVFENVQARARTYVLMSKGFVIGTGDMSELALGWATYNGDHMSMYNPNCSIPKTLVKFLVKYVAENMVDEATKEVLLDIFGTTISPELLPLGKDGEIVHSTEDAIGPYELHDFFLFHLVRNGFAPNKILFLACSIFEYDKETIKKWLKIFLGRFFNNQFKRSCVPDGPKVGSVSLSPRGDWRMPSDAQVDEWLLDLEK